MLRRIILSPSVHPSVAGTTEITDPKEEAMGKCLNGSVLNGDTDLQADFTWKNLEWQGSAEVEVLQSHD